MSRSLYKATLLVTVLIFSSARAFCDEPAPSLTWPGLAAANRDTLTQDLNLIYGANVRMSDARSRLTALSVNYDANAKIPEAVSNEMGELMGKIEVARRERNFYMSGLRVLTPDQLVAFQKSIPEMKKTLEAQAQSKVTEYGEEVNKMLGEKGPDAAEREAILKSGSVAKLLNDAGQMRSQIEALAELEAQFPAIIEQAHGFGKSNATDGQIEGTGNPAIRGRILTVPDPTVHTSKPVPK